MKDDIQEIFTYTILIIMDKFNIKLEQLNLNNDDNCIIELIKKKISIIPKRRNSLYTTNQMKTSSSSSNLKTKLYDTINSQNKNKSTSLLNKSLPLLHNPQINIDNYKKKIKEIYTNKLRNQIINNMNISTTNNIAKSILYTIIQSILHCIILIVDLSNKLEILKITIYIASTIIKYSEINIIIAGYINKIEVHPKITKFTPPKMMYYIIYIIYYKT